AALTVDGDEHTGVRATFDRSYATLAPDAQRLFRLLDRLAGAHLLTEQAPGRYAFHDLLRAYAADRARAVDSEAERRAAVDRLARHYLSTVDAAARVVYPGFVRLPVPDP